MYYYLIHFSVSMYSENGETSVHMPSNLPRKLASKMGVDKSIIDKGNDTSYEEMQHSDGKVSNYHVNFSSRPAGLLSLRCVCCVCVCLPVYKLFIQTSSFNQTLQGCSLGEPLSDSV